MQSERIMAQKLWMPAKATSPAPPKVVLSARGRSWRVPAMTRKVIALEFVVPTALAVALGFALSFGAVYLTDRYLLPDPFESDYAIVRSQ